MISEKAITELFSAALPSGRRNANYESDAELIELNGVDCLFTTDEFSAEDLFQEDDPYRLGWNIAAGAISDILACGGLPRYYAHALTVTERWDAAYLTAFSRGVGEVLKATGTGFIGGDCGRSTLWRCTVSVIGTCPDAPVLRRGAAPGDLLYLSGPVGAGNLEAALALHPEWASLSPVVPTEFPLRLQESTLVRKYASAGIDTSDGLLAALNTLADVNACGYAVADPPYSPSGAELFRRVGLPATLLFLGGCGEYELLFTVRPNREPALLAEADAAGCTLHRLGRITPAGRVLHEAGRGLDLQALDFEARDFATPQDYVAALAQWLARAGTTAGPVAAADPRRSP